eukprot:COSAG01_NODE_59744_length_298_cov_1.180905_1_plen_43_part_10
MSVWCVRWNWVYASTGRCCLLLRGGLLVHTCRPLDSLAAAAAA